MNKKFSTLLMGGLLLAGAASAQTLAPIERTAAETTVEPSAKYYYQIINGNDGVSGYALQATTHNGKDSVKVVDVAALYTQLSNANAEKAISALEVLDSTLWAFTPNGSENLGYYSIENKATGKKLQFAKEGNAIMASGLNAWFIEVSNATYNDVQLKSYVINADGSKSYYTIESGTARNQVEEVKIVKANAASNYKLVRPADIYMNAAQLNAAGDGNSFKLAIEDLADTENPFVKTALKAYDLSPQGSGSQKNVCLQVVGGKILKADENKYTGEAKYNKNVFVVVDTTMYDAKGGVDVNGTDAFGYKFASDSANVNANGAVSGGVQAPGRHVDNYRFAIYKDVTVVEGDQLIIKALGTPEYDKNATASQFTGTPKVSYVSWAGFAAKGDELTTARIKNNQYVYELPIITLAAGAKADITPGVYFLKDVTTANAPVYAYANMSLSSPWTPSYAEASKKDMKNDLLSRTQYVVTGSNGKYSIVNRESGDEIAKYSGRIYVDGDNFVKGGTKFVLEAVPAEVAADNHVGYKFFSKEEVGNVAVSLLFNSGIGNAYIYRPDATKAALGIKNVDAADAQWFKIEPVDTVEFGVDMERAAYILKSQFENKYLSADGSVNNVTNLTFVADKNDASPVVFRSTGVAGQYQIIFTDDQEATPATYAEKMYDQLSVLATEAKFNKLAVDDANGAVNGYWTIETPAAPDYLTIEDAPAHKRIFSSENSSLAISMNAKKVGILKSEADTDAEYIKDQFSMWIDTACVEDVTKPLYYISTCAGLDSAARADGYKMYMMPSTFAPVNGVNVAKVNFVDGYVFGADSLAISTYKADGSFDKMKEYKEMAKNPAAFAFQMTPAEGEYIVENIATKSYLRQVNGVLYLTENYADALTFGIEAVDTPTANEDVEVSSVTVIAGEGQVTIAGAAGKKVVVSNILGQVVANTVITSDNAPIAAPQGVVVVAVEGEEAVKAIVK